MVSMKDYPLDELLGDSPLDELLGDSPLHEPLGDSTLVKSFKINIYYPFRADMPYINFTSWIFNKYLNLKKLQICKIGNRLVAILSETTVATNL